jgi:hypothetical protein
MNLRVASGDGRGGGGNAPKARKLRAQRGTAFTLLEVIIACTIFFMVAFAVLELVAGGLAAARSLQQREPDAGMLAAIYAQTNILTEDPASGDFEDFYPDLYPGYTWTRETVEVGSNGLFQADFVINHGSGGVSIQQHRSYGVQYATFNRRGPAETRMSILLFRPGSPAGSATKSLGVR